MSRFLEIVRTFGPYAAIAACLALLSSTCGRAKTAEDALARRTEADEKLKGKFNVATLEDVADAADKLLGADATLRAQKAALERQVGKVKIVRVVEWRTLEVPATGTAVPCEPGGPACVLRLGDKLRARVPEIEVRTGKGNDVGLGHALVERTTPSVALLLDQPFEAPLSSSSAAAPEAPFRWGAGAWGVLSTRGSMAGAKVDFPPVRILGVLVEVAAGPGGGPGGVGIFGSVSGRWR